MSGKWLVASFLVEHTVRVYSLPGLLPVEKINLKYPYAPRSSSDGLVYVPNWRMITELKISQEGSLYVRRNITLNETVGIFSVAVGPQTGQLCVSVRYSIDRHFNVLVVSLGNVCTIQRTLTMPDRIKGFPWISALHAASTDQVLVTTLETDLAQCTSVLYKGHQPSFLTNLTHESCVSIAHRDHFLLVDDLRADILVLDDQGRIAHTIDYGNGYISAISALAVWQDSVFVVGYDGALLLLSPV